MYLHPVMDMSGMALFGQVQVQFKVLLVLKALLALMVLKVLLEQRVHRAFKAFLV